MIEELKIIAEILKNVTDGALTGTIVYMVLQFLQKPVLYGVIGFFALKIVKIIANRPQSSSAKTIEVVEIK